MKNYLLLILLISPYTLRAQFTYDLHQDIKVSAGGELSMPWAGGLNASQYNTIDLNGDEKDDLVLFDRMAGRVITFLNVDNNYNYTPEYEPFFPKEITNWLLLRDFNCDGRKDIFTGDNLGIKVYQNITEPGGELTWKQFYFYTSGSQSAALLSSVFGTKSNLQLQFDDLPSIVDADGDGDLDIFSMRFSGNGTVEFHQNYSQERGHGCDSLDFERVTSNWGEFTECACGIFAFNNEACSAGGRVKHAGGKSLLALDANGDNTLDMLLSESTCNQLSFLPNTGSSTNPIISTTSPFPLLQSVNEAKYPAPFFEDVDFDGVKDLMIISNVFARDNFEAAFDKSNWFYKNTGTTTSPSFIFQQNDFLQEQMIDVGDNSVPAFFDYDSDGDYDLFISQYTSIGISSRICLFKNTGSATSPQFNLEEDDYLNFSTQNFFNLKIQFADITNDGKVDLVFTGTDFNNTTRLGYFPNTSSNGLDLALADRALINFSPNARENLLIYDINNDGLTDILLGTVTGALNYFKNVGTKASPSFTLEDEDFLGIQSSVLRQNIACTIADLDNDGDIDLLMGDQTGEVQIISDFHNAIAGADPIVDVVYNPVSKSYHAQNLGGRIWPTVVNLFGSSRPAIVVGNTLGGLHILRHNDAEVLPENPIINVWPNPVRINKEPINIKINHAATVQFINTTGQEVGSPLSLKAGVIETHHLPNIASGLYLFRFTVGKKTIIKRIVVYE